MSKIQKISISNFKAIQGKKEMDFNGCHAIITGGNDKGKTSFLRGIPDRIRFIRPSVIVNENEEHGRGEMELTTGEKFIWEYDNKGKDKLVYIASGGVKQSVTKDLGEKFFPPVFDIDKFLNSPPKSQVKQLQQILNVDFSEIEARYLNAYNERTAKNLDAEILTASQTNVEAQKYVDYINYKSATEAAKEDAQYADDLVKQIEEERQKMIEAANFPTGISINSDGITIDGLPLEKYQISLSKLYITALRIAALNVGEVRTLYFEASPLDRANLEQIEQWANENDLQLLIERPAFDGGEITYEIVETK